MEFTLQDRELIIAIGKKVDLAMARIDRLEAQSSASARPIPHSPQELNILQINFDGIPPNEQPRAMEEFLMHLRWLCRDFGVKSFSGNYRRL